MFQRQGHLCGIKVRLWIQDYRGWGRISEPDSSWEMLPSTLSPSRLHFLGRGRGHINKRLSSLKNERNLLIFHYKRNHPAGPRILRKILALCRSQWPWNLFKYLPPHLASYQKWIKCWMTTQNNKLYIKTIFQNHNMKFQRRKEWCDSCHRIF